MVWNERSHSCVREPAGLLANLEMREEEMDWMTKFPHMPDEPLLNMKHSIHEGYPWDDTDQLM
jgi:hypothetical protein